MLYNDLQKYADQHNDQSLRLTALVNEAVLCSAPNVEYDAACARAAADEALILARKLRNPRRKPSRCGC